MISRFILGPALAGLLLFISPVRANLYDMVEMTVASAPGVGTITLGSAIPPYQSITATPAITGETVDYQIRDGNNWENGRGVLNFGANVTLTRGVVTSSNANAVITAGTGAVVWITLLAEDMVSTRYASQVLAPISAPTCTLTNAATITINLTGCVSNSSNGIDLGAITLTQNSTIAFPTGLPTGGNLKFGFRINPSTFTATFAAPPSGYRFPAAQLTAGQPTLTASTDNYVWCVSQEGSPPTLVDCSNSMVAMTAVSTFSLVNHGIAGGANNPAVAFNTTGADLIVLYIAFYSGGPVPTVTSALGNTFTQAGSTEAAASVLVKLYYSKPTSVGSDTFTCSGTGVFCSIGVKAFAGTIASPLDTSNGATLASGTTLATGSVTPSQLDIVVAAVGDTLGTSHTIGGGFITNGDIIDSQASVVNGGGIAYLFTSAVQNPSWSWSGTAGAGAVIASFK